VLYPIHAAVALYAVQDAARGIASISREAGLEVDEEEYLGSFRPSLMDVFYSWSKGKSFAEVSNRLFNASSLYFISNVLKYGVCGILMRSTWEVSGPA
jgi:superfamily II RNA helicase